MSDGIAAATNYVLDASALLAAFFEEPGADIVAEHINGALLSTVNCQEVIAKLIDRGASLSEALAAIGQLNIEIISFDREQAERAGALRSMTRKAGLSLGDRSCLALASIRNATALTADRHWAALDIPDIAIRLIR